MARPVVDTTQTQGRAVEEVYRIRNWDRNFENNRTRELKNMTFVPIPNDLGSDGYVELVSHQDGPGHFAVWITLVQIASKCDPRGTLLRSNRHPHAQASLARISRLPEPLVSTAIKRLLTIGWLEVVSLDDATGSTTSHLGARKPHDRALKERRKERKKTTDSDRRRQSDISSEQKSQLAQTLNECGVRNKRTVESLALTPGLTVGRINQLHARAVDKAKRDDRPASGLLVTMVRDRDWENIRYDTPKAAVDAYSRFEWQTMNGMDCTDKRVTCNANGVYVEGELVVRSEDLGKAKFE